MKLLCIFAAVLAFALAESESEIPDSLAVATELLKEPAENLEASASAYNYVSNDDKKSRTSFVIPPNSYQPIPPPSYVPPHVGSFGPPPNSYVPPTNNYVPPQNTYVPPQNSYVPPQNSYVPPQNDYVPPQNDYVPPQNSYVPPQNTYYPPHNYHPSTTTPIPVIKNELTYGDNGSYQYEYQIADGTHVGEQGYFLNPRTEDESLVKKGWYSYTAQDGKVYTVTWWADHTGFHASGDHLPTPPPIPPAIQAAIDQNAKEEAQKQQAGQKPGTYPTYTEKPYYPTQPTYYPTQATYYPTQPTYNPNPGYYPGQSGYYPNQPHYNQPSYGKKDSQ